MFLGRSYESGVSTYPPIDVNRTVFYAGTYTWTVTDVAQQNNNLPVAFGLKQNYPNPFNPATKIDYTIAQSGPVSIRVYNTLGQEVATVVNETLAAGPDCAIV